MNNHYLALVPAYASIALLWFLIYKILKTPWENEPKIQFNKPWLEFVYAILAVVMILCIGQLYQRDLLIPNNGNNYIDALNQILIFSPTILVIIFRKHHLQTIWLPKIGIPIRLFLGITLSLTSLLIYWVCSNSIESLIEVITNIYHAKNISHLVQVFMEDITIALLFVRLSAWIGRKWTISIVAVLFAAGHIPSLITNGATIEELLSLFIDTTIGVIILSAVSKSKDIWWFFLVHFTLDMTQYYGGQH